MPKKSSRKKGESDEEPGGGGGGWIWGMVDAYRTAEKINKKQTAT